MLLAGIVNRGFGKADVRIKAPEILLDPALSRVSVHCQHR